MHKNFSDYEALHRYVQEKTKDNMLIAYRNCDPYEGMVLGIMIVFDIQVPAYQLDLQWMSFGLDPYGDTLQESYVYQFEGLEALLEYLKLTYEIKVEDIPVQYKFDPSQHPDPIKDKAQKSVFEAAWKRFQDDFNNRVFLDPALQLVYDTHE